MFQQDNEQDLGTRGIQIKLYDIILDGFLFRNLSLLTYVIPLNSRQISCNKELQKLHCLKITLSSFKPAVRLLLSTL